MFGLAGFTSVEARTGETAYVARGAWDLAATRAILKEMASLTFGLGRLAMTLQTPPAIEPPESADEERAAKLSELLDSEPLPMIQKSIDAFRRDLPGRSGHILASGLLTTAMSESASARRKPNCISGVLLVASRATILSSGSPNQEHSIQTMSLRSRIGTFETGCGPVPTIIRDLPYFDEPTRVQVRGRRFP